jgi:hypothetical protein
MVFQPAEAWVVGCSRVLDSPPFLGLTKGGESNTQPTPAIRYAGSLIKPKYTSDREANPAPSMTQSVSNFVMTSKPRLIAAMA